MAQRSYLCAIFNLITKNFLKMNNSKFYDYDARGVRAFVRYADNGLWAIGCFRKKLQHELKGDGDYKMIYIGHIASYHSRQEAELAALELAESICVEYKF